MHLSLGIRGLRNMVLGAFLGALLLGGPAWLTVVGACIVVPSILLGVGQFAVAGRALRRES